MHPLSRAEAAVARQFVPQEERGICPPTEDGQSLTPGHHALIIPPQCRVGLIL